MSKSEFTTIYLFYFGLFIILLFYLLFEMVLHELIISRMLKSNLQLIGELYKLREEGSSLDVYLVGIDGKTQVHLPVLIAANPWLGDIIDDRDQVHVIIMPDYSVMELESFVDRLYCHTPVPPDDPFFRCDSISRTHYVTHSLTHSLTRTVKIWNT